MIYWIIGVWIVAIVGIILWFKVNVQRDDDVER
jgi:hypothetical protein